jgi:hypothetical protein
MSLFVKDTCLSLVRRGDFILYKAEGLLNGDFLGELIATFEGGQGRYTHVASVRDVPEPNAAVTEIQPGIFKVEERQWKETQSYQTGFEGEVKTGEVLRNTAGIKLEATWPKCREGVINWESPWIEVWRVRNLTSQNIDDILRIQQDMVGYEAMDNNGQHADAWDYNIAEFLTFGLLNQAAAKICSQFEAEPVYTSTLIRGCRNGNYPIALTPDLHGIKDPQITPNDLALSGWAYRVTFQGLLS